MFINSNWFRVTKLKLVDALHCIQTATLCSKQNIAKQRFINKSLEQFASVSLVSIPDSCTFYRLVINHTELVTEKEGHNMQISSLDLLMRKRRHTEKAFCVHLWVCMCVYACMHKWVSRKRLNGWISGWKGCNNYLSIINPQVRLTTRQFTNVFAALNLWSFQVLWEGLHFCVWTDIELTSQYNSKLRGISANACYNLLGINNTVDILLF